MNSLAVSLILLLFGVSPSSCTPPEGCRNVPGSAGYPSPASWTAFNATIFGRLIEAVPTPKYCADLPGGPCTDAQWSSALFRSQNPGSMVSDNVEQGYDLTPPSLCLKNATTCGQGDVPLYSVEAEMVEDVQAAVKFASAHNLRVAIKASGHDVPGRSTAPHSLLIRTRNFRNLSFTDNLVVGSQDLGPAVTVGTGVFNRDLFQAAKANGRFVLATGVATICAGAGYVQGAGHSPLSPQFGLAADNALEFKIVVASGELLTVNSVSHPDLFYALRGGGAGSWGVIVSTTFKTFPALNGTSVSIVLATSNTTATSALASLHAQHVFDLDPVRGGHYLIVTQNADGGSTVILSGKLPNASAARSKALLAPFVNASTALPGVTLLSQGYTYGDINDALFVADDTAGGNVVAGSRFITPDAYRQSPEAFGSVYQELLDAGSPLILEIVVGGGAVADNTNISSAVHPGWRTAKSLFFIANQWEASASLDEIDAVRKQFQTQQLPILERISGPNAGSYSNEGDISEPNFMTTYYGPNYATLSATKAQYDPNDLFIVAMGVGSERWDRLGLCRA
ncbi:FAD-binding domain-containing protein [Mycena belliarum]|uniref:FAD-binding domain-containing protein n=1 Tax=Mycena belliarum TaxID=1033014 RepID=A0AAD6XT34_9AGAR|nr:FAD-binding domain-containing protein [Mycena belliae]